MCLALPKSSRIAADMLNSAKRNPYHDAPNWNYCYLHIYNGGSVFTLFRSIFGLVRNILICLAIQSKIEPKLMIVQMLLYVSTLWALGAVGLGDTASGVA
jgi:hypothetical protein